MPPPKAKDRYHHGDLRQAITMAAVTLIGTKGEATFSLREIAASISVSHAAVYRHFDNKRAVLAAVAEEGYKILIGSLTLLNIPAHAATAEIIRKQFTNYVQFALENPGYFRAMFHQDLSAKQDFPALEKISAEAGELLMLTITRTLESSPDRKDSPESLALAFWSMMHGFAELALNRQFPTAQAKNPLAMNQRIAEVIEILLQGLA